MKLHGSAPSRGTVAGPAAGSLSRTSRAAPAVGSDGVGTDKAVGPTKPRLSDHAMISIAEAYAAIQYDWDRSCSESELGNDEDDNYKQRGKYVLIDLEDGAWGGTYNPVQTKPKKVKKDLKKDGQKRKGRKRSASVQSAAKTSEDLVMSDQQQEEILPRNNCFKRTTLPKKTNDKCLIPVENVTDGSSGDETGDCQGIQLFPDIESSKAVLSDVGDCSLQEQLVLNKVQDKSYNPETVPDGKLHDSIESKVTCVIVLSDSDEEMDEFVNTEPGDSVAGSSEMPKESDSKRQMPMEGTTPVSVLISEQQTSPERKDLVLLEGTTPVSVSHAEQDTSKEKKEGATPVSVNRVEQDTSIEIKVVTTPVSVHHVEQDTSIDIKEGSTLVSAPRGEQHTSIERKDLVLMETVIRPDELYSDDEFVIEPNESCDFEIDLSDSNTVRTSDMIQPRAVTFLQSSEVDADEVDDCSDEETIVQIELQSDFNGGVANQTVMKERSLETQSSSVGWPVVTSCDDEKVHDDTSVSVRDAIHKPDQAPIQNLKSCSRDISCPSSEQYISSEEIMRTAKVIHLSGHGDESSEGLSCARSGSQQRSNQTNTQDVHNLLHVDPSIRVPSDPLSVFSDHMAEETRFEAPKTVQSCDECQLNFTSADLLLKHFSKVHKSLRKKFAKRKRDRRHIQHSSSSLRELNWSAINKKGYPTLQNAQICVKSDLRPSSPEMLRNHSVKVEETGIYKHKRKHKCTICGVVNMSSQALHKHLLMHVGITSFDCEVCGKAFSSASDFGQHLCIHQKHLKNQEYKCNEYSMTFAKYARLMSHKTEKHQDECSHSCVVCGKTFQTAVRLKSHMLVHSGKKEFHCSICEKSFKSQKYLDSHMYSHSQDRPFACCVCDKRFKRKQNKDAHEMKHENPLSRVNSFVFNHPRNIGNPSKGIKL